MARELESAVVALVSDILGAEILATPDWLVRPGKTECGTKWQLVQAIYRDLTGMTLPDEMRPVERRTVDAVLKVGDEPPRILEFDEKQHFNTHRARTISLYRPDIRVAYDTAKWSRECARKTKLEGGGFAAPRPPLFPGQGGRHRQRAFRDALTDIVPLEYGWLPTLRFADFEVGDWVLRPDGKERFSRLLETRLTAAGTKAS